MALRIATAATNVLRSSHMVYDPVDGIYVPSTLLEGQRTGQLLRSTDVSVSPWGGAAGFTISDATSLIEGRVAKRLESDGLSIRSVNQVAGTLTGAPETLSVIVENVDAVETEWGIRDNTANDWVARGRLTWATGAVQIIAAGVGSSTSVRATDPVIGPDGGQAYRLEVTGTPVNAGNERRIYVFPSGNSQNTQTAIIHYVGHELGAFGTSPIVTEGSTVTRAADSFRYAYTLPPQAATYYVRFIEQGSASGNLGVFHVGSATASTDSRISVAGVGGVYSATHDNGTTESTSTLGVAPSIGQRVELRVTIDDNGVAQAHQSIDGATETSAAAGDAATLQPAWADTRMYVNSRGSSSVGFNAFLPNANGELVTVRLGVQDMATMRTAFAG